MSFVRYVSGEPRIVEPKLSRAEEPSAIFDIPRIGPVAPVNVARDAAAARYRGDLETPHVEQRRRAFTARDLMNAKVIVIGPSAKAHEAQALMVSHRFHHLPVVDRGQLVGIISDRDILSHAGKAHTTVATIMSHDVLTARPEARIADAAKIMVEHSVGALPIVNEHHQVVGIVTRTDVLRCVMQHAPIDLWV